MIDLERNYYEILELEQKATRQEIEEAYIKAKETYSPSSPALYSMFSPSEAKELHSLIERAYAILTNPDKRKEYDNSISDNDSGEVNTEHKKEEPKKDVEENEIYFNGTTIVKKYDQDHTTEELIKNFSDCNGAFIQKIRYYKGITLEELSEYSKISKTNILAIEAEDFDSLPVKVFVRGFVSQITKLIGLDSKKATDLYMSVYNEQKK